MEMKKDKKLSLPMMAIKNLKAQKFRTAFMLFFVVLMSATVFFSTLLMDNLEAGIHNTTERMGADLIVVPNEGTEGIRESFFAGKPCSVFFDKAWEDAVRDVDGVERVSSQMYIGTLSASCCDVAVQLIAYDQDTDFVVKPWIDGQKDIKLEKGQVLVGDLVRAEIGQYIKFYEEEFEVVGRLEQTGMGYDNSVFMGFETLFELKNSEVARQNLPLDDMEQKISMLMVDVEDGIEGRDLANVKINIRNAGPKDEKMFVCSADELMSGIADDVQKLSGYGNVLTYISLISTALALISIFVITINERKYEFGVLYTLGASKRQMTNIIMSEALIISGVGGVVGTVIAYYVIVLFKNLISNKLDIPFLDVAFAHVWPIMVICVVIAVVTGVIAAVCSSYGISKGEAYRLIRENE